MGLRPIGSETGPARHDAARRASFAAALIAALVVRPAAAQLRADLERLPRETLAPAIIGLFTIGEHRSLPAPGEGRPCGLAWCRNTLWLLRADVLLRVDPKTGAELESLPLEGWIALAADQRFVLAAKADGEIAVIDPLAGRAVRTIPPAGGIDDPIRGITVLGGRTLLADAKGRVLQLDEQRTNASLFWGHPGLVEPTWIAADGDAAAAAGIELRTPGLARWAAAQPR